MYPLFRKWFFQVDAETVHGRVMNGFKAVYSVPFLRVILQQNYSQKYPTLERELWGLKFPNPVGLAAGFDKNAKYTDALSCLGFGFIEIGTVTPRPQAGNPKPRLFRLPEDKGLINRMGFNNDGAANAADLLKMRKEKIIIGGNIGKNKDTPNENAVDDYEKCFRALYDVVDYFTVNVSSPNTPGLRALQDREPLTKLLSTLQVLNKELGKPKPILLKIDPNLTDEQLDTIIEVVEITGISGIIATNTTLSREGLKTSKEEVEAIGMGGLSGAPVKNRSTEVVRHIHAKSDGRIPIIASGGIFTAEDAAEKLEAGASLVQVYSGFIYEGPGIVKKICEGLVEKGYNFSK